MKKTSGMLAVLLAVQLGLAVGMTFTGPNLTAGSQANGSGWWARLT